MSQREIDQLLNQARAGDRDSLQELLCNQFDRLLKHIEFRIGNGAGDLAADDILQETFVHAVRDIEKCLATSETSFFAWLKGVADNRLRDALKQSAAKKRGGDRKRIRAVKLPDASSIRPLVELLSEPMQTPSVNAADAEAVKAMQVALLTIPDDQRQAIMLRSIEGYDLNDVAEQMGKTPDAVRGLIHRGKQSLKDALGNSSRWFSSRR